MQVQGGRGGGINEKRGKDKKERSPPNDVKSLKIVSFCGYKLLKYIIYTTICFRILACRTMLIWLMAIQIPRGGGGECISGSQHKLLIRDITKEKKVLFYNAVFLVLLQRLVVVIYLLTIIASGWLKKFWVLAAFYALQVVLPINFE